MEVLGNPVEVLGNPVEVLGGHYGAIFKNW